MPLLDSSNQNHMDVAAGSDFVEGPGDSPVYDNQQQRLALKREIVRLETFKDWPPTAPISRQDLARDGFYYLRSGDKVKCIYCNLILKNWDPGDVVRTEHTKFNPQCAFLLNKNVGNVPISANSSGSVRTVKYPDFSSVESRILTFGLWPVDLTQKPETMARAGFFFTGDRDSVTCFHCGGNLRNWEPTDDPVLEHRHWFPNCEYVKNLPARTSAFETTPTIKQCIDFGYDEDLVRTAVLNKRKTGGEYHDVNALIDAVEQLKIQIQGPSFGQVPSSSSASARRGNQSAGAAAGTSGSSSTSGASSSIEEEYRQLLDQMLCKVCMERSIEMTFQPCGHFVVCEECSRQLQDCPMCRQRVRAAIRTYMS